MPHMRNRQVGSRATHTVIISHAVRSVFTMPAVIGTYGRPCTLPADRRLVYCWAKAAFCYHDNALSL